MQKFCIRFKLCCQQVRYLVIIRALRKAFTDTLAFGEAISHVISEFKRLNRDLVVGLYQPWLTACVCITRPNLPPAVVSEGKPDIKIFLISGLASNQTGQLSCPSNRLLKLDFRASFFKLLLSIFSSSFVNAFFNWLWSTVN